MCLLYLWPCTCNFVNCGNFSCCTYEIFLCSYIASSVFVLVSVCVCVGEHFCRLSFCMTLLLDRIDNNNNNDAYQFQGHAH